MMARKTIELLIKLFMVALIAAAGIYSYKVLGMMGIIS
jgi:hypothetical protein